MSIELKQAAQRALNALDEATTYTGSPSWSPSMTDECIAAASALRTALAQQPATGEPVAWSEREQLRHAQAAVVMPMIGPLLDAWENSNREVMSQEPELSKQLKNINSAMEDADTHPAPSVPVTGEPVWCVATGELVNGEETYTHHDAYVPLADCFPIYTRPAPSVPDDVARNAERWCHAIADGENQSMNFLDIFDDWDGDGDFVEAFDAAILAANEGGK